MTASLLIAAPALALCIIFGLHGLANVIAEVRADQIRRGRGL